MKRTVMGAAALALALASIQPAAAQRIRTGLLDCDVSGGFGWIIGSQKSVSCVFTPDQQVQPEYYVGTISKFGLDLGATAAGRMVWGVFMETVAFRGAISGDYIGASGEATLAIGLGANVLVGGSNRSVALQPLSVTGQAGLNLALGVAQLSLRLGR
jgi:hypothetical protein